MEQRQAEIEAIRAQIKLLQEERASFTIEEVSPEDDSPKAITEAYRRQARESAKVAAEVKGIDDAIGALQAQIRQKQAVLTSLPLEEITLVEQVAQATQQAYDRGERINELAAELVEELRALKAIAHDFAPVYWDLYDKPFITGFQGTAVPYLRSDNDVLMISSVLI
jgi:chromosome segregation ATPase